MLAPGIAAARANPRPGPVTASPSPCTTSVGQETRAHIARVCASSDSLSFVGMSVSASVFAPQPTASSVGFVECGSVAAAEEEFEEPGVVAPPGVAVVAGPAGVGVELRIEVDVPLGSRSPSGIDGPMNTSPLIRSGWRSARMSARRPDGQGDDHRALGAGRVEDRPRVLGELGFVVGVGGPRPIGAPVAPDRR